MFSFSISAGTMQSYPIFFPITTPPLIGCSSNLLHCFFPFLQTENSSCFYTLHPHPNTIGFSILQLKANKSQVKISEYWISESKKYSQSQDWLIQRWSSKPKFEFAIKCWSTKSSQWLQRFSVMYCIRSRSTQQKSWCWEPKSPVYPPQEILFQTSFQVVPLTGYLLVAKKDCLQLLLKHSLWFSFTQNTLNFHTAKVLHNVKQSVVSRDDQKITFKLNFLSDPEWQCIGTHYFGSHVSSLVMLHYLKTVLSTTLLFVCWREILRTIKVVLL